MKNNTRESIHKHQENLKKSDEMVVRRMIDENYEAS
jgi:hypothetical protein